MARPPSISDERIIEAARQLFLEKGIRGTAAEVAERLGISEGTVFHRFHTKFDLFRAAMQPQIEDPEWVQWLIAQAGQGDLRHTLFAAGMKAVEFARLLMPLWMMGWSNPGPQGLPSHTSGPNCAGLRTLKRVASFFEAEMRAGRMRRHDPEIVARTFMGGIHNYVLFELLFSSHEELPLPAESFLRGMINLI